MSDYLYAAGAFLLYALATMAVSGVIVALLALLFALLGIAVPLVVVGFGVTIIAITVGSLLLGAFA